METENDENIWPKYNAELKELAEKNIAKNDNHKNRYLFFLAGAINNIGYNYFNHNDVPKALVLITKA